jgi:uncharacterized protein (DUF433 family)
MLNTFEPVDVPLYTDAHGKIRVRGTRVLLDLVIQAFQSGDTPEAIVENYSTLQLADVYAVLSWYLLHTDEVDAYLQAAAETADRIQQDIEAGYTPERRALHARLRALRVQKRRAS